MHGSAADLFTSIGQRADATENMPLDESQDEPAREGEAEWRRGLIADSDPSPESPGPFLTIAQLGYIARSDVDSSFHQVIPKRDDAEADGEVPLLMGTGLAVPAEPDDGPSADEDTIPSSTRNHGQFDYHRWLFGAAYEKRSLRNELGFLDDGDAVAGEPQYDFGFRAELEEAHAGAGQGQGETTDRGISTDEPRFASDFERSLQSGLRRERSRTRGQNFTRAADVVGRVLGFDPNLVDFQRLPFGVATPPGQHPVPRSDPLAPIRRELISFLRKSRTTTIVQWKRLLTGGMSSRSIRLPPRRPSREDDG